MAAVRIHRGVDIGFTFGVLPKEQWDELVENQRRFCTRALPNDCRQLLGFIEDARKNEFAGYANEADYIREGLGLDPEAVSCAVDGLRMSGSDVPVPFNEAVKLGKNGGARIKQPDHGKDEKTIGDIGGNSSDYIAARLQRDHPEIVEAVERGEFTSMRQAGIAAGFVKPRKTATLGDPAKLAARILEVGQEYAEAVRDALNERISP